MVSMVGHLGRTKQTGYTPPVIASSFLGLHWTFEKTIQTASVFSEQDSQQAPSLLYGVLSLSAEGPPSMSAVVTSHLGQNTAL